MAHVLLKYLRHSLPPEIASLTEPHIVQLENGEYEALLSSADAQALFGHVDDAKTDGVKTSDFPSWNDYIFHRLSVLLADRTTPEKQSVFFCVGYAALLAFLQSNVTGPPLPFSSAQLLFHDEVANDKQRLQTLRRELLEGLGMDGIAAYKLTPNIELLCLAEAVFTTPPILKHIRGARWAKLRLAFLQQRLLSEVSSSLQEIIYNDLELLKSEFSESNMGPELHIQVESDFRLEQATIHIHHGFDKLARQALDVAKQDRHFQFALTGRLGKRTKFQEKDISQLVVLAKSNSDTQESPKSKGKAAETEVGVKPANIDLNDDTLLESISFSKSEPDSTSVVDEAALPQALSSLDPSSQPQLDSLDSAILLAFASSITNTSPQDGLTREETLPYATRVLEGGSSNWQVYTQALLVRSRIEGYRPRTVERGLLQLQAVVDQVIADTTGVSIDGGNGQEVDQSTTFLPRPKQSESAPVTERLQYIFQLASPYRWDLEAELASRWVQIGGFRSALDIYERLELWAEAALCWAATDREDKAKLIVRRLLFHATNGGPARAESDVADDETWEGPARDPAPTDAPRLYCILGDMDQAPEMYEKAWELSKSRYARAKRSLGRYYFARKEFAEAAEAYSASLKANQLNESSWFALGCAQLELAIFSRAVEAFSRCVQLDETDAEAWSNLAAALLRKDTNEDAEQDRDIAQNGDVEDDDADFTSKPIRSKREQNRCDALEALKRAAALKRDSYRIWENVLIAAASLSPPEYTSVLAAQKNIINLRGSTDGEKCIDVGILEHLVQHIIALSDRYDPAQPGLQRMVVKFIDESVVPLITGSAELWRLIGRLALWRNKPSSALDAEEKAWRVITSQPGWETESEARWNDVVEATIRLCDSYESLGPRERTEGMGAGEQVAKDWKFKARTAIRGIMGRGKGSWDGTDGWDRLKDASDGLRN